jgi:hypothetical protein
VGLQTDSKVFCVGQCFNRQSLRELPVEYSSGKVATTPGNDKCPLAFSCCSKTKPGTERSILFLIMDCGVFCTLVNAHIANQVYVAIHMTMDGIKRESSLSRKLNNQYYANK